MTSQLNVDTIVDKAGSGGTNVKVANTSTYVSEGGAVTQNTVQGLGKNWQNHSSGTTLNDSFNQSTLTDNGTGNYTMTFTNNMANTNYLVVLHQRPHDNTSGSRNQITGVRLDTFLSTGSYDQHHGKVSIGGDGGIGGHTDGQTGGVVLGDLA